VEFLAPSLRDTEVCRAALTSMTAAERAAPDRLVFWADPVGLSLATVKIAET
jgi:hypothetical protein